MHRSRRSALLVALAGCGAAHGTPGTASCPADRNIVLSSQDDVPRYAACESASGLTIRTGATITVSSLKALETITGDLTIGPTVGTESIALSELREVGGSVTVQSNGSLNGLFFPRLETAGRISIEANVSLATISMPRLVSVSGSLLVANNAELSLLDISALTTVGKDLTVLDNRRLTLVEAGKLQTALTVRIEGDPALAEDQAEALRGKTAPP